MYLFSCLLLYLSTCILTPMPDLLHSLLKQDIGHLRIIAEFWGLELNSSHADSAREELSASLLETDLLAELIDSLPPEAHSAITALVYAEGRIPWPTFTRKYGDIREAGAGKRDREKLYLKPSSTAEILYYRGLLARAFFDTEKGPQEFAYVPDDLLELIKKKDSREKKEESVALRLSKGGKKIEPLGRPASPNEKGQEILADDFILDDATTLLAALRMGKTLESDSLLSVFQEQAPRPQNRALLILLNSANLLKDNIPEAEAVKVFLESPRVDALKMLQDAWMASNSFNELKLMPALICEGEWDNPSHATRHTLLNFLNSIPKNKWWGLSAFVRDIKQKYADFQRPAGDYDSWFIKRASDGQYLRGFEHWDEVDGALIRFFIINILPWLGQVDLSIAEGAAEPTAFRIRSKVESQKSDVRLSTFDELGKLHISSQGKITAPRLTPHAVRYQLARFCEWEEQKNDEYKYRLTPHSLTKAKEQGLKVEHLLPLLAKHSAGIPPSLVKALKRWEVNGTEARVETQVVLRVGRPEILEEMRKSKASKFLGEVLSPTAVIVKSGAIQKVMEALTELGLLAEDLTEEK